MRFKKECIALVLIAAGLGSALNACGKNRNDIYYDQSPTLVDVPVAPPSFEVRRFRLTSERQRLGLVLVLDSSGSMQKYIPKIKLQLTKLFTDLAAANRDLDLLIFNGVNFEFKSPLIAIPADARPEEQSRFRLEAEFWIDQCLEAPMNHGERVVASLAHHLRAGDLNFTAGGSMPTTVLAITDADEPSSPEDDRTLEERKARASFRFHAIGVPQDGSCPTAQDPGGTRWLQSWVSRTGGVFQSVCNPDTDSILRTFFNQELAYTNRFIFLGRGTPPISESIRAIVRDAAGQERVIPATTLRFNSARLGLELPESLVLGSGETLHLELEYEKK